MATVEGAPTMMDPLSKKRASGATPLPPPSSSCLPLPRELTLLVFAQLDYDTLCACALVSRTWADFTTGESSGALWEAKLHGERDSWRSVVSQQPVVGRLRGTTTMGQAVGRGDGSSRTHNNDDWSDGSSRGVASPALALSNPLAGSWGFVESLFRSWGSSSGTVGSTGSDSADACSFMAGSPMSESSDDDDDDDNIDKNNHNGSDEGGRHVGDSLDALRARRLRLEYARLSRHNTQEFLSKSAVQSLGSRDSADEEPVLVPLGGDGLDTSCKKLVYNMMWMKETFPFPVVGMSKGQEGFGSGIDFLVNGRKLTVAPLYRSEERDFFGESSQSRPAWQEFFARAGGLAFVVDGTVDGATNCEKLHQLAAASRMSRRAPLLVLSSGTSVSSHALAAQLKLDSLDFACWACFQIDDKTLEGLPAGLAWLASRLPLPMAAQTSFPSLW